MSSLDDFVNGGNTQSQVDDTVTGAARSGLAMFKVDQVTLPGSLDIIYAAVKNNILFIAVTNRKLLRIDLANPAEIQDLEVPRSKGSDGGDTLKIHLDDLGQHLILTTSKGENWYFHAKLSKPAKLKVKGVVESVAWNAAGSAFSTKEILLGMAGGSIIETSLEPTEGFNKTVERYSKQVHTLQSGDAIEGMVLYSGTGPRQRHVLVASRDRLEHFQGSLSSNNGDSPALGVFSGATGQQDFTKSSFATRLALVDDPDTASKHHYAWLCSSGVFHGPAPHSTPGHASFEDANLISLESLDGDASKTAPRLELSAYHILIMQNNTIHAFNRFDGRKVYQEHVKTKDVFMGMMADPKEQTYWLYSRTELYEIVITDEAQDMWNIYLKKKDYASALKYASTSTQYDAIYAVQAQSFMKMQDYEKAAEIFGRTSLPIEQVALKFLDLNERDALRIYLSKKLEGLKKTSEIQRTMLATWILELYMTKLSALDDLQNNLREPFQGADGREVVLQQYESFVSKHRYDLDRDATYSLINSHGRPAELMIFASAIQDYEYIVNYHIQQDQYAQALQLLVKWPNLELTYATSTVLMPEIPSETVEMWMRMQDIDPVRLLPALFLYNERKSVPIGDNQAIRYLHFVIKHQDNISPAIHNALVGLYAKECGDDERPLLEFLEAQSAQPYFDLDFGLRQCKEHDRVMSCVHIYSSMGLYDQAVQWALQHDNLQLAGTVADRVEDNPSLRKKLWLMIAKKTITQPDGTKAAIELTKRTDVLRIEDLVPHFGDFTIIDDFKDDICHALETYSQNIEALRQEMDDSSKTAETIAQSIQDLKKRFAVIQVGEECYSCHRPLTERQFHVFPCQHTFHTQCLIDSVVEHSAPHQKRRIAQLQSQLKQANALMAQPNDNKIPASNASASSSTAQQQAQKLTDEMDELVAAECLLCGSLMIRSIDEGFDPKTDKAKLAEAASWRL